uniref:Uncharacterized protein n=1 Tax=Tanacetum cinerariifolium TaxID=118510 RepID=A0A6L2KT52_TANCI|nr:hypothetical protein [Tanacetum cinerariifolium]
MGQAKDLGILPPHELSTFGLSVPACEKKKIRRLEILKEDFVKENVVVDGIQRKLVPPPGVEGRRGLVIREPESRIFFYNDNFDLVFQREKEFHLATTTQLIRLYSDILRWRDKEYSVVEMKRKNYWSNLGFLFPRRPLLVSNLGFLFPRRLLLKSNPGVGGLCWGMWWRASGSRGKWWNGRRSGEKGCGSLAGNRVNRDNA